MNKDYTDISVVQDKSGSMRPIVNDTIKGFNAFLEEQKKAPGKCTFTLMQFDTNFRMVHSGEDIRKVEPLNDVSYSPGGGTALLDAIGRTITTTGQRLDALPDDQKPGRVVVVIMTDGEENSSREYGGEDGRAKIFAMIKHQTDKYNWVFIFLGANQDAIQAGAGLGIASANAISTSNTGKGTQAAYAAASSNIRSFRSASPDAVGMMAFSEKQRDEQYKEGATKDSMAGAPPPPPQP